MWGIKMSAVQRIAAWPLSWAAKALGQGHRYVPGERGNIYVLETAFEDNNLTHNADMYDCAGNAIAAEHSSHTINLD